MAHLTATNDTVATTDPVTINHIPGSTIRYASLDSVRGLAAVSVILFHTSWPTHVTNTVFVRNCYTAVDLFFLLSGFVIAASYQSRLSTRREVMAFFERRVFRVYPLQWAVMAWLVTVELAKLALQLRAGHTVSTHDAFTGVNSVPLLVANLLLIQGTGLFSETSWNPPSWSVSSEVVAYVVFAMTGYFGLLRNPRFIAALACCGLIAYATLAWLCNSLDLSADFGIVRCLAGFPIGVAVFQLTAEGRLPWLDSLSVMAASALEGLAVVAILLVLSTVSGALIVLIVPCFAVLIMLFQIERGVISRALTVRPLQFIGAISYSIYLVHVPILTRVINAAVDFGVPSHRTAEGHLILDLSPARGDALLGLVLLITLAVAVLTFRLIEEPARLYGRRLSARR